LLVGPTTCNGETLGTQGLCASLMVKEMCFRWVDGSTGPERLVET